ncbi:Gfo/Idh/MocA family oxidoreductase [Baekduia soli]|uniref:Gfo/Idh/MocA family oxidoreductase n=1 Tax=Baekduia soli TaxID=496014 RepID=A0A5B8UCR0_9ACTN|nr:Gfo/Idh/MocA family oxidoreductase [Baekduia soli]QEC50442.1 Gfo/Idh/MocA family oxidoreductase [Baekduia soli]
MGRQIGIGLLGAGWMGAMHSAAYRRVSGHFPALGLEPRLVIAADDAPGRAERAVRELGYEQATSDWRAVIAHPEVEAVSLTAPNALHREMALTAAAAGKHVWGEKPLGLWPHETAEIAEACAAAGIMTTVGFNYRHAPLVQHAAGLLAGGELGPLTRYRGAFLCDYASHPDGALTWRFLREQAGLGVLGDLMSHVVDMAHLLVGPIVRVCAQSATIIAERPLLPPGTATHFAVAPDGPRARVENEDWAAALVEFEGGLRGTLEVSRVATGPHAAMEFDVHGTDGALSWSFERLNELRRHRRPAPGEDGGYATVYAAPHHPDFAAFQPGAGNAMGFSDLKVIEARGFLESIRDGMPRAPEATDALAAARVVAAMARSVEVEGWVAVGDDIPRRSVA